MKSWEAAVRSLIDDPSQAALVQACYFDPPLAQAAARYAGSDEWQAMRTIIGQARGLAIDIGAGNGIVSYALARDGWNVAAIEPDPSDLVGAGAIRALAKETGTAIDVRPGTGEGLPVDDASAALIIARQVLHHASDLKAFAREIARVLKPGGMLVSTRDHVISGPGQLQAFLGSHPLHALYGGENAFTRDEYREALTSAGLKIEQEFGHFDSVINYAPHTRESVRKEITGRLGPLGPLVNAALSPDFVMHAAMRMLSLVDQRPGRLVTFVCRKPA